MAQLVSSGLHDALQSESSFLPTTGSPKKFSISKNESTKDDNNLILKSVLKIGERVEDIDGFRGTVRYIGSVCTSKDAESVWIGVEWDSPHRGKHDGSVENQNGEKVCYFQCSFGKGSFVKEEKLKNPKTLNSCLKERYCLKEVKDNYVPINVEQLGEVMTSSGGSKPIEFVGAEKVRSQQFIGIIDKASLQTCCIASIGDQLDDTIAPNLSELDLQDNLIYQWKEIMELSIQFPKLQSLQLSGNRFATLDSKLLDKTCFPELEILVLNKTGFDFKTVSYLGANLPMLSELYLAYNHLSLFNGDLLGLKHLTLLDLSGNQLSQWEEITMALGRQENLKHLILNHNLISKITIPSDSTVFSKLESLSLNDNKISEWASLDSLNGLSSLIALRFQRNPLTSGLGAGESRQIIVSRVKGLQNFNGGEVRLRERQDAEKMYVKRILFELMTASDDKEKHQQILSFHPRFHSLMEKYPDVQTSISGNKKDGASQALSSNVVTIKITSMAMDSMTQDPFSRKFPLTMTISQLQTLLYKKFKLEPDLQQLHCRISKKDMPFPLDNPSCELGYYGLQDESEIILSDRQP